MRSLHSFLVPILFPILFMMPAFLVSPNSVASEPLTVVLPSGKRVLKFADMKSKLKTAQIEIDDPVYGAKKRFDAFELNEVLKLAGWDDSKSGDEIVFTAKDGYAPNTSFEKLKAHKAYLVYEETGTRFKFGKVAQGKAMVSPAPYYVVWEGDSKTLIHEVPWPYQLAKIEVVDFASRYPKLYPSKAAGDAKVMAGFKTFKSKCINCHSINLEGGDIGPELNAPKNVTEYWDSKNLKSFIKDAGSFRYKSKMPAFKELTDGDVEDVLKYLEHMKGNKVPAPGA